MEKLTDAQKWQLIKHTEQASESCKDKLGAAYMVDVVSQLSSDAAAELLRSLPADFSAQVIAALPEDRARDVKEILAYPTGTAGAGMAKEYLSIPACKSVAQAIAHLQVIPKDRKGKVPYIYVLDQEGRPQGVIQTKDLIFNLPETPVKDITRESVVTVSADTPQDKVAQLLQEGHYLALPVITAEGRLTGIISADSLLQFIQQQADSDIAKMVGTDAEELSADSSVPRIMQLRLPWLMVSIASGLFCAFISDIFHHKMQSVAMLLLFVPVVLGLSESTGIQGATIVVRNMTRGKFSLSDMGSIFFREVIVGILISVICAVIVGVVTAFWQGSWAVGLAMACSLVLIMIVSAGIGLVLPVIFKAVKLDPAFASGPLVLAICDIQTLFIYFNLANWVLTRFSA